VVTLEEMGLREPAYIPIVPDEVEALIGLGRYTEAEALLDHFRRTALALTRGWAAGASERCEALLLAARGEPLSAMRPATLAVAAHRCLGQPLELARSLLTLGTVQRRARQWGAARHSLAQASALFADIGVPLWEAKSRAEGERIGGRRPRPGALTETELQVAQHVAAGRTNREVAELMFISINTVESNLSKIYAKLGVRSRTQLVSHLKTPLEP
jgi:DNA-binding CsgD family transcriptional regulator